MNMLVPSPRAPQTMSSREIADLLEARHDNVRRTIERLAERGVIQLPPLEEVKNHLGQAVSEYQVGKRDSYVIVAQLSPEFTARLVDRWEQLERQVADLATLSAGDGGRAARTQFKFGLSIAKMLGLTGNQAALSANRLTQSTTGFDVLGAMGHRQLVAPVPQVLLNATEIGQELGAVSPRRVNSLLEKFGFQVKRGGAKSSPMWEPTELGVAAGGRLLDVERSNHTGTAQQLRWPSGIIETLRDLIEASK